MEHSSKESFNAFQTTFKASLPSLMGHTCMAKNNNSWVWSTLHFHPKQIHGANRVGKRLYTKTGAHRNWKTKHDGVCVLGELRRFACVQTNVQARGNIWSFYWAGSHYSTQVVTRGRCTTADSLVLFP